MRCRVSFFAVLLVACSMLSVPFVSAVSPEEAAATVADADSTLSRAFVATSDADSSGANVSGLMGNLTKAGAALTAAKVALAAGNYTDAVSEAGVCRDLADDVLADAGVLKSDAVALASGWWLMVSFSVVGSVVVVVALFLVWRRFKRYYADRLLESKLKVAS